MQTISKPSLSAHSALEISEIRQRLAECQRLIDGGQSEVAAVLLESAFESALRASLTELGRCTEDPITIHSAPAGLVTQAVAYGVIDPKDREALLGILPNRDVTGHGYAGATDASLLEEVIRITERTLDEIEQE